MYGLAGLKGKSFRRFYSWIRAQWTRKQPASKTMIKPKQKIWARAAQASQLISILIFFVPLCIAAHHMIWVLCTFSLCAANRFTHKNVLQHDPIEYIYWVFFRFASVACDSIAWSSHHFRRHIEPSRSISTCMVRRACDFLFLVCS